ncbi:MAG: helix-turn-helix transcriptional regulator [Microbacteriaceae bacterium]
MPITNNVRILRRELGLTQEELSRRCLVSRQTIVALEAHAHEPTLTLALRVARQLGGRVEDIFTLRD